MIYNVSNVNSPLSGVNVSHGVDSHSQWAFIHPENQPGLILIVFATFISGAIVRILLQVLKLPYTIVLALCGLLLGSLSVQYPEMDYYVKDIANISPRLLIHAFMPVLIFNHVFQTESHIFWKSLPQVLQLAIPGYLLSTCMTALLKVFIYNWDWYAGMMFGAIVSTIDPFTSTELLRGLGTLKPLILLMEGEALFSDGTAFITFDVFKDFASGFIHFDARLFTAKLLLKVFVSPLLGVIMSKAIVFWLSYVSNDDLMDVVISFAMPYIAFYIAEFLSLSGIITVVIMALFLDGVNFSPEIQAFLIRFWKMLAFLADSLIFLTVGLVLGGTLHRFVPVDIFTIIVLYCAMSTIRLITIIALSPLLTRTGYGFNWRWAVVCIWGGTKGAYCLILTITAFRTEGLDKGQVREKVLVLCSGIVALMLLINATTIPWLLRLIGLCDVSVPKLMAMYSAVERVKQRSQDTLSRLRADRFLADANWGIVEQQMLIDDPYKTPDDMVSVEDFTPVAWVAKCPDCETDIPHTPSPRELEGMYEEARLRILKVQKMNYGEQHSSGMLNQEAARILINLTDSVTNEKGKFMNVEDIKKYWELKGFFVSLRQKLEDWLYNVKINRVQPSRNPRLKWLYEVVFSFPFDNFFHIVTFLNIFPIVMEFYPEVRDRYSQSLSVLNYIFFSLYIVEATLKALAMRRAYIFNHWNKFDLFIILMAAIDIFMERYFGLIDINIHMIGIVRVLKMFRLTRALRLVKILIPKVIKIISVQIYRQLNFGYDIGKGFITAEEYVSQIIDHICDDINISKRLRGIIDNNKQEAARELGLLQRDYPEIASSVKTRQAIRIVLNSERDTIQTLMSGGLLDNIEASKLEKMIEMKITRLNKFPPTIPAPTVEELIQNVPWLNKDIPKIELIKRVAKHIYFEFGETIIHENDAPPGIYLIVFGVVKITGESPYLGGKKPKERSTLTDYRGCGAILGELNCLAKQPMEATVTCETAVQTCFIDIQSLFEAFDIFPEHPALEYKIWHSLAMKLSINAFMGHIRYEGWTYHRICARLAKAYLVDLEMNGKFDIHNGLMEDVVVIYGSCEDLQSQCSYNAPELINRTTVQILGTANRTKLFIVPTTSAETRDTKSEPQRFNSAPCLRHAAQRRASRHKSGMLQTVKSEELTAQASSSPQLYQNSDLL